IEDDKIEQDVQLNHPLKQQEKKVVSSNDEDGENDETQLEYLEGFEDFKF
ncbi:transcription termination/antitermination protein NusA, partial [Ureaplasma urealyticum]